MLNNKIKSHFVLSSFSVPYNKLAPQNGHITSSTLFFISNLIGSLFLQNGHLHINKDIVTNINNKTIPKVIPIKLMILSSVYPRIVLVKLITIDKKRHTI